MRLLNQKRKVISFLKNEKIDFTMTEKGEHYRNNNICHFCEKEIISNESRDHYHLTGKSSGPAHQKCNNNNTKKQSNYFPSVFHNFNYHDYHLIFGKLVDKKNDKAKIDIIPHTNEEYISITDFCIRFVDSFRFHSNSLDSLVKTLVDNTRKTLKILKEIVGDDDIGEINPCLGDDILNFVN